MKIILFIILVWIIYSTLRGIVGRYYQCVRDRVAHNILDSKFDFNKKKEEILSINKRFNFVVNPEDYREFVKRFHLK